MITRITIIEQAMANTFDEQEQERADEIATEVYNEWIRENGLDFDETDYFDDADLDDAVGREW